MMTAFSGEDFTDDDLQLDGDGLRLRRLAGLENTSLETEHKGSLLISHLIKRWRKVCLGTQFLLQS